jgi:hypothetical protein
MQLFGPQPMMGGAFLPPASMPSALNAAPAPTLAATPEGTVPAEPSFADGAAEMDGSSLPFEPATPGATFQLFNPADFSFENGETVNAEVMQSDPQSGQVMLGLPGADGPTVFLAQSDNPPPAGTQMQLQVQNQTNGLVTLSMSPGPQAASPHLDMADLANAMMDANLPTDDESVMLGRTMVEFNLPVTQSDFSELRQVLSQLPTQPASEQDMQAASFLKSADLPVTPQNVQTLATFLTQQPQLGMQLMTLQQSFRKLAENSEGRQFSSELSDMLGELPGLLGEYMLDPTGKNQAKLSSDLRRQAFQSGIEDMGPHVGDDFDMLEWLQSLRDRMQEEAPLDPAMARAGGLLEELGDNLAAQRLMNSAVGEQGNFYFQIPMQPGDRTGEARFRYHVDGNGRPLLDPDNITLELLVPTRNLGSVAYNIAIRDGHIYLDAAVESQAVADRLRGALRSLVENLEKMSYHVQDVSCRLRAGKKAAGLQPVARAELETLGRVDCQA